MYEQCEAGKVAQIAIEMRNCKLTLLGLCETRWTQSGQQRLLTGESVSYFHIGYVSLAT